MTKWFWINILLYFPLSGLHLTDSSTPKNGALELVKQSISSSIETVTSNKRMKMNCFEVPARLVLYFLSWSGFLVSFMMRNDINFALVVMVKSRNETNSTDSHVIFSWIYDERPLTDRTLPVSERDGADWWWTRRVRLGLDNHEHGAGKLLLDVRREPSRRRSRDATLWHQGRLRLVAARDCSLLTVHSSRSIDALAPTDLREVDSRLRQWADLARNVRNRWSLDSASREKPIHVEFSGLLDWHRSHISAVWLHHRSLRLAPSVLHFGNRWNLVVHHVVLPRLQHTVGASEDIAAGAWVHRAQRVGWNQRASRYESSLARNLHQPPRMVHRHHNVRPDLGALHVHHARTGVHEEHPQLWHSKQWRHIRTAVPLLVPVVGCFLLRRRCPRQPQDSQSHERAKADDSLVANHSRWEFRICSVICNDFMKLSSRIARRACWIPRNGDC